MNNKNLSYTKKGRWRRNLMFVLRPYFKRNGLTADMYSMEAKVMAGIVGAVYFFLIGKYATIASGIAGVQIQLEYTLLYLMATQYGLVTGAMIGAIGGSALLFTSDITNSGTWVLVTALLGTLIGLLSEKMQVNPFESSKRTILRYIGLCFLTTMLLYGILGPAVNVLLLGDTAAPAFRIGRYAGMVIGIPMVLIGGLLTYRNVSIGNIVTGLLAVMTAINVVLLYYYRNFSIGTLLVLGTAVVLTAFSLMYKDPDPNKFTFTDMIRIAGKSVIAIIGIVFIVLSLLAYAYDKPTGTERYMIVLGASLDGDQPSKILRYRLDAAASYLTDHPELTIITSGGQGGDEVISEGEAMRNYLMASGIDGEKILAETRSTTTEENFAYSLELIEENGGDPAQPIVYVTNDFHCWRSGKYAKQVGFTDPNSVPAGTPLFSILPNYLREVLAIVKQQIKSIL